MPLFTTPKNTAQLSRPFSELKGNKAREQGSTTYTQLGESRKRHFSARARWNGGSFWSNCQFGPGLGGLKYPRPLLEELTDPYPYLIVISFPTSLFCCLHQQYVNLSLRPKYKYLPFTCWQQPSRQYVIDPSFRAIYHPCKSVAIGIVTEMEQVCASHQTLYASCFACATQPYTPQSSGRSGRWIGDETDHRTDHRLSPAARLTSDSRQSPRGKRKSAARCPRLQDHHGTATPALHIARLQSFPSYANMTFANRPVFTDNSDILSHELGTRAERSATPGAYPHTQQGQIRPERGRENCLRHSGTARRGSSGVSLKSSGWPRPPPAALLSGSPDATPAAPHRL